MKHINFWSLLWCTLFSLTNGVAQNYQVIRIVRGEVGLSKTLLFKPGDRINFRDKNDLRGQDFIQRGRSFDLHRRTQLCFKGKHAMIQLENVSTHVRRNLSNTRQKNGFRQSIQTLLQIAEKDAKRTPASSLAIESLADFRAYLAGLDDTLTAHPSMQKLLTQAPQRVQACPFLIIDDLVHPIPWEVAEDALKFQICFTFTYSNANAPTRIQRTIPIKTVPLRSGRQRPYLVLNKAGLFGKYSPKKATKIYLQMIRRNGQKQFIAHFQPFFIEATALKKSYKAYCLQVGKQSQNLAAGEVIHYFKMYGKPDRTQLQKLFPEIFK